VPPGTLTDPVDPVRELVAPPDLAEADPDDEDPEGDPDDDDPRDVAVPDDDDPAGAVRCCGGSGGGGGGV
jgi:hypothetical protein